MTVRFKILGINIVALIGVLAAVLVVAAPAIERAQGMQSVVLFVLIMLGVGFFISVISVLLLERLVIRRVEALTRQVKHIRDYRSYYDAVPTDGRDEVTALARAVNQMLQRIVTSTNEAGELNAQLQAEKTNIEKTVAKRTAQLRDEKARLKASVANLSLGFIMTDAQSGIMLVNAHARQILETEADVIEAKPVNLTIDEIGRRLGADFDLAAKLGRAFRSGQAGDYRDVPYGQLMLRIMISPVLSEDGASLLGCVIVLDDITEQKLLERSRDEFFSIASHELRTPLTAIRGNTSLIKQFYTETVHDKAFDEMVDDIHASSVRLIQIVNDFLDASRLEQGKIAFKTDDFDLTSLLESVVYETSAMANEKGVQVLVDHTLGKLPKVRADQDRIKQVIYNLVGNALKFTDQGTITIGALPQNGMIKVTVTDTGKGISPADQQLLFRKFQQVGSDAAMHETSRGTGLGLYISKLLVNRMGGVIALDRSELGVGTTLSFTIPQAPAA